uniref:Peptidase M14 domain-containing protein n=1 Tax=Alexandrium monilatum TaxID=311494 RepID=A0A7S4Q2Y3_9DINO
MAALAAMWAVVAAAATPTTRAVLVGRQAGRIAQLRPVQAHHQLDEDSQRRPLMNASGSTLLAQQFYYYHSYAQVKAKVRRLAKNCGQLMSVRRVEESGVSIDVVRVRRRRGPEEFPAASRVFLISGEHARELIGSESALHFLRALCGEVVLGGNSSVERIMKDSEFAIVLNANPRARELVEQGDYCRRLNARGVDLNRNWDEWWSPSKSMGGSGGPRPFSEPETRLIRQIVEEYQPTLFLSVHSGTRGLYMPWAYQVKQNLSQNQLAMLEVLRTVDADHCRCPYGAAGHEVGYACPGTSIDWAYGHLKTPYAFAFEIWGGNASLLQQRWEAKLREGGTTLGPHLSHPYFRSIFEQHPSDFVMQSEVNRHDHDAAAGLNQENSTQQAEVRMLCFRTFNPATRSAYMEVVENWAEAFLDTSQLVAADILARRGVSQPALP